MNINPSKTIFAIMSKYSNIQARKSDAPYCPLKRNGAKRRRECHSAITTWITPIRSPRAAATPARPRPKSSPIPDSETRRWARVRVRVASGFRVGPLPQARAGPGQAQPCQSQCSLAGPPALPGAAVPARPDRAPRPAGPGPLALAGRAACPEPRSRCQ